jgi:2-dehydro-3-deoxyphosphogluconate aldolase/(4S)-4-hydroxy-2-oxoglutarate aldolase
MNNNQLLNCMSESFFVPVIRGKGSDHTLKLIHSIIEGGIELIELTYSTPDWTKVFSQAKKNHPKLIIGAGTVLTIAQCVTAQAAGADFIVSPGFDPLIANWATANQFSYFPGVMTPSEIMLAMKHNLKFLKLFPSQLLGPSFLKAMRGPFPDIRFFPTGGIALSQISQWLIPEVFALGLGSEILKPAEVDDFHQVTLNIQAAINIRKGQL